MSGTAASRSLVAVLGCVLTVSACSDGGPDDAGTEPSASPGPTSLADVDAGALPVVRGTYCEAIGAESVETALNGPVAETSHYADGERARLTGDVRDVAGENGCTYLGEDGARARTWLFVPPVTPGQAQELARSARRADGCEEVPDAAPYGDPSAAVVCGSEVSYRGLFGDAWLSCSLRAPADTADRDALLARADTWCLAAATAAAS